ncbi:MAG: glycine cleavage T C-terminal barrel domain-containing protein [Pseudomonadota bacterium]
MALQISPSPRVRKSPFYEATLAEGASSMTVYNHMMMPTGYGDPFGEYWRLIEGVAMWDVAVERQVELRGPDAARLAQTLVPRRVANQPIGQGWYVPVCDHEGVLLNDPVLLKLADDRFWLSIADSDMLFWARAIAGERRLDVEVFEPDVSPLAVQGPKAEDVIASMFGDEIRDIRHFAVREMMMDHIPIMLARSGWSKQGGFEIYLMDSTHGPDLWNRVKEAGAPYEIGPGNPNPIERIESGLLSWGGDTDDRTNPFEVNMSRFVDVTCPTYTIGIEALRKIKEEGPTRHQLGIFLDLDEPLGYFPQKLSIMSGGTRAGLLTATAFSPRLKRNIGMCLISRDVQPGDTVEVVLPDGRTCGGEMTKLPFL